MSHEHVKIQTSDGTCPADVFTPEGVGPWPAAILFMDGAGIRPALKEMARRLSDGGYVVLLPDLYYRIGTYGPLVPKDLFAAGNVREAIGHLITSTDNRRAAEDSKSFLDYLAARPDVKTGPALLTGYCMGGAIALTVAATYSDRIAAVASFHGGNLATDAETSPHLLAPAIKARVYIAGADKDASYPPEMAERLEHALSAAGVNYRSETYADAMHGWTMTDFPVYDEMAAERHWRELFALFASATEAGDTGRATASEPSV